MSDSEEEDGLVQYIIIRSDLKSSPLSLIAQCCKASRTIMHMHADDMDNKEFMCDLIEQYQRIHILEVEDHAALSELSDKFKEHDFCHISWKDQGESLPTCIAIKPQRKEQIHEFIKDIKVLK